MRCFQADLVFTLSGPPIPNGIVVTDQAGTILDVGAETLKERYPGVEKEVLHGALCPGFINTHCHLELSVMKGSLQQGTGMAGFIREFISKRGSFSREESLEDILKGEQEMLENGIVAVGDIANTNHSFDQKANGNLYYHTFLEAFDLHPSRASESFLQTRKLREELVARVPGSTTHSAVVPHAPYTVSPALHEKISAYAHQHNTILCIHSQESNVEDDLFRKGTGPLKEMYDVLKLDYSWFKATGTSSLESTLGYYKRNRKLLLVHNTRASKQDMLLPSGALQLFWATCPRANLFIENKLPDYSAMLEAGLKITIGTDSLASNTSLSVLEEMKTIAEAIPTIDLQTLVEWACINGAEFMDISKQYGTLEKGKKPGLVLISDLEGGRLTAISKAKRIL
ncbi:MAG: amidohydrolase family protein [Bacteroidia bacterium]